MYYHVNMRDNYKQQDPTKNHCQLILISIIPSNRYKTTAEKNCKLYINLFYKITMYL